MSSNSSAKKVDQQQQFFFNRPALPRSQKPSPTREVKPASSHSPLAQYVPEPTALAAGPASNDVHSNTRPEAGAYGSPKSATTQSPADLLQNLQNKIHKLETHSRRTNVDAISTGCEAFDQLLPENGLVRGTIVEWLADGPGNSAATLALIAARNACEQLGTLIVVDPQQLFYPPAAAAWGVNLKNTIVLRPQNAADQNWAIQQSLACPAVAAVWAVIDEIDERSFRRFQLAAEQSGCLGLFHRPAQVRNQPSWSEIQLAVRPLASSDSEKRYRGRRLQVQLLKCRGGANGRRVELEINEATGAIRGVTGPAIRKRVSNNRSTNRSFNTA